MLLDAFRRHQKYETMATGAADAMPKINPVFLNSG
jgi:hypothetical protein